jgi:MFS family permease
MRVRGSWWHRLGRAVIVDVTPLRRSREYRWLYSGFAFARIGRQMTVVAVPYQAYELTGSTLIVGMLGAVQLLPLIAMALIGGALADAVDRKKLLVSVQLLLCLVAAGLMVNSISDIPALWPLFVLSALNAALSAVDSPTRAAVVPNLVRVEDLPSALALNQMLLNVAKAIGPAFAGAMIAAFGLPFAYGLEILCFALAALLMSPIRALRPEGGGTKLGVASVVEGLRYVRSRPLLKSTFLIDLNAMVFGLPQALFPAMGIEVLGGDAAVVGLLYSAPGFGALAGALTSGWVSRVRRQGMAVIVSVVIWGLSMVGFGLAGSVPVAVGFLALAGLADVVSAVFRTTILQLSVPDSLRGRLSGVNNAVVSGGPRLGDVEAGVVASLTSVQFSVVSGGVACVLGALAIARKMPELARYRSGDGEPR